MNHAIHPPHWLLWGLLSLLIVLLALLAWALALGGPNPLPPLESVNRPFTQISLTGLPDLTHYTARDGTALAFRHYAPDADAAPRRERVVLVHGSSASGRSMHALAQALAAAGFMVDALDMRGHGDSGPHGDLAYIGQLKNDVVDFLQARPFTGSNVLLGFSAGGGFVLRFAASSQQTRFARYVLLAPYLGYDAPTNRPANGDWASVGVPRIIALRLLNALSLTGLNHLHVIRFALDDWGQAHLTPSYSYALGANFAPHANWRADITQAHQPMQVLVGADDELFHPEQFAPVFAQASPKVPVTVVPDVGHITLTLQHQAVQTVARLVAQAGASTVAPSR